MRVLITGVSGFVGQQLASHLQNADRTGALELHGTLLSGSATLDGVVCHPVDLREPQAVHQLIEAVEPQQIYHLAAQAFVPRSFEDPWETLENNIRSQLNITLACAEMATKPKLLVVSSAEIYGVVSPESIPISEELPLQPTSPYSVSKVTQDMLALQYHLSHQLPIMRARPFNHIGPGQNERFVAPAFAMQIARIEAGLQEPVIEVGDLSAERDFTDVRDIVNAYRLILEQGEPGAVYNVASGKAHSIRRLLDTLLGFVELAIEVRVNEKRLRPVDIPVLLGDASQLRDRTGWEPVYTFEQSLLDVLNDCRTRVKNLQVSD